MRYLLTSMLAITLFGTAFGQWDDEGQYAITETEYRYVTKGIKVQIESGLDMKSGYEILTYTSIGAPPRLNNKRERFTRSVSFSGLFREGDDYPCAIIAIHRRSDTKHERYFCIPSVSSSQNFMKMWIDDWKAYCAESNWSAAQTDYMISYMGSISYAYSKLHRDLLQPR